MPQWSVCPNSVCNMHSVDDPYWHHFPNGDHPAFGKHLLGHYWNTGLDMEIWATYTHPLPNPLEWTYTMRLTPIGNAIKQWKVANGITNLTAHATQMWAYLCTLDSDGDGMTNGAELGDPNCLFPAVLPSRTSVTDPNTFNRPNPTIDGARWCYGCRLHMLRTTNDPYFNVFPNGDNPRFGFFKLGHYWTGAPVVMDEWNISQWNTIALTPAIGYTPVGLALQNWISANMFTALYDFFGVYPPFTITYDQTPHDMLEYDAMSDWVFSKYINLSWPDLCLLDSDGDGYSNGEELGDPLCQYPTKAPHRHNISDPNNPLETPHYTPSISLTASPSGSVSYSTTPSLTISPFGPKTRSRSLSASSSDTGTASRTRTEPCFRRFSFDFGGKEMTARGCVAIAGGDPHYELLDGTFTTCNEPGWVTLVESEDVRIEVKHVRIGSGQGSAISEMSYHHAKSGRRIFFDARGVDSQSSDDVLINENGAVDVSGANYVEIRRVKTVFGTFMNVLALVENAIDGIYVKGCDGQRLNPSTSPACDGLGDPFSKYVCNADVELTGSTEFVEMARGVAALKSVLKDTEEPKVTARAGAGQRSLVIVYVICGLVGALAIAAAVAVVIFILRKREEPPNDKSTKVVYVVS